MSIAAMSAAAVAANEASTPSMASGFNPPACVGMFADVPCPATADFPYSDWVEELYAEAINAGCLPAPPGGKPSFCPGTPNTRGEMAVFIVKAFDLLLYGP